MPTLSRSRIKVEGGGETPCVSFNIINIISGHHFETGEDNNKAYSSKI